jgi:predicted nucleic acid-binding protein
MIAVINASPLIFLGKIGALNLLPKLFDEIVTTEGVKKEVLRKETAPEKIMLDQAFNTWLHIKKTHNPQLEKKISEFAIQKGEITVLVLAFELLKIKKQPITIIDDRAAREIARTMGLTITGTIGIVLRSVKEGHISKPEGTRYLNKLSQETDFRMPISLYARLLSEIERL